MLKKTNEILEMMDELMGVFGVELMKADMLTNMDMESFKTMKICMQLYQASKELAREQAVMMDEVNEKLDALLDQGNEVKELRNEIRELKNLVRKNETK